MEQSYDKLRCNPVTFINVLHRYTREDFGSVFLYLPTPKRQVDQEAWTWLQVLKSMGTARRRWIITADHAAINLEHTHPHLFTPPPVNFEVYRLHQDCLTRVFAKL